MDDLYGNDSARKNLQERLLDAVKQCQTHFGARHEVATETDLRVSTLCLEWEAIFTHGLKRIKTKMRAIGGWGKGDSAGVFWHVVKPYLSDDDRERFSTLKNINSDIGRGRAWLRTAINERTLENYLHTLLASVPHLKSHYESHAFLLDHERSSILPIVAAGLNSIIFGLTVDEDYLNSPVQEMAVPVVTPNVLQPLTTSCSSTSSGPSFIDRLSVASAGREQEEEEVVAVKKTRRKKKRPSRSPSPASRLPPPPVLPSATELSHPSPTPPVVSFNKHRSPVHRSTEELPETFEQGGEGLGSVSPHAPADSGASTPSILSVSDDSSVNNGLMFVAPSDPEEAIKATSMVLAATEDQERKREHERSISPFSQVTGSAMSEGEMKQALLSLVRGKQEVEEVNARLEEDLEQQRRQCEVLESQVLSLESEVKLGRENQAQSLQALERENDLLREQLRRQLNMAQHSPTMSTDKKEDKKLSEMAEMYGEVIEFNDRLHHQLLQQKSIITKLAHTLITSGIELPVPADKLPPEALTPKKAVEVSIPSVIKKGRGPDTHHVYQVFVQIDNDEWNIYRRFAEFWEFHNQLLKHVPEVSEFNFPPRRAIGNKTAAVVEERRLKLQDYLRYVLDLCAKPTVKRKSKISGPIIHSNTSKDEFLRHFPFFREGTSPDKQPTRSPSYSGL